MRTTNGPSLSERASQWLHPVFLFALALLIANDVWFKPLFHNALTGKLSDFAGVFAFAYFWSALAGRREAAIHVLVGIAFALWKSPWSQPAIDAWNALGVWPVARVVDASDLLALAVLPFSWRLLRRSPRATASRIETLPGPALAAKCMVAAIAVVAFTATSKAYSSLAIEADYLTPLSGEQIKRLAEKEGDDDKIYAYGETLEVYLDMDGCDRASAHFSAHAHGAQTVLRMQRAEAQCGGDAFDRDTVLAATDAELAAAFSAKRVKAGVGSVGPALTLTDPPAEQCPNEAARSTKPTGERGSDGTEPTYPPKARRRAEPATTTPAAPVSPGATSTPAAPAAASAPAASPETPSPSAARNSN